MISSQSSGELVYLNYTPPCLGFPFSLTDIELKSSTSPTDTHWSLEQKTGTSLPSSKLGSCKTVCFDSKPSYKDGKSWHITTFLLLPTADRNRKFIFDAQSLAPGVKPRRVRGSSKTESHGVSNAPLVLTLSLQQSANQRSVLLLQLQQLQKFLWLSVPISCYFSSQPVSLYNFGGCKVCDGLISFWELCSDVNFTIHLSSYT